MVSRALVWVAALLVAFPGHLRPDDRGWEAVQALPAGAKVEVRPYDGAALRGHLLLVDQNGLSLAAKSGERAFARAEIASVGVPSPGRRVLFGAIAVAAGVVAGFFACPSCVNEGAGGKAARNVAIGAGAGSLVFLIPAYRAVYKGPGRAGP
jgi:hypothetical protein